jgi:hypothetical protein
MPSGRMTLMKALYVMNRYLPVITSAMAVYRELVVPVRHTPQFTHAFAVVLGADDLSVRTIPSFKPSANIH